MRYFWFLIVALVVVTGALNITRRAGEANAATAARSAPAPAAPSMVRSTAQPEPIPEVPVQADEPETDVAVEEEPEPSDLIAVVTGESDAFTTLDALDVEPQDLLEEEVVAADEDSGTALSLDALLGVIEDAKEMLPDDEVVQAATDPMLEAALAGAGEEEAGVEADGTVGPAFTVRGDGAVEVEGAGVIIGDGSPQRPYVLDWQVMRSVARDYNPKQGQEQLPDWVMQLDGKAVRVEGNTLLPVVAAAVDELLVMQNPWDGCCIGIPPTPYDAIEVKLADLTRMGNTATGFGQVEGTFRVDPYLVQGWLLGLYLIEDASFESAAGMELPGL